MGLSSQDMLTSLDQLIIATGICNTNTTAKQIAVFLFQLRGLHHHPPVGDHTYFG